MRKRIFLLCIASAVFVSLSACQEQDEPIQLVEEEETQSGPSYEAFDPDPTANPSGGPGEDPRNIEARLKLACTYSFGDFFIANSLQTKKHLGQSYRFGSKVLPFPLLLESSPFASEVVYQSTGTRDWNGRKVQILRGSIDHYDREMESEVLSVVRAALPRYLRVGRYRFPVRQFGLADNDGGFLYGVTRDDRSFYQLGEDEIDLTPRQFLNPRPSAVTGSIIFDLYSRASGIRQAVFDPATGLLEVIPSSPQNSKVHSIGLREIAGLGRAWLQVDDISNRETEFQTDRVSLRVESQAFPLSEWFKEKLVFPDFQFARIGNRLVFFFFTDSGFKEVNLNSDLSLRNVRTFYFSDDIEKRKDRDLKNEIPVFMHRDRVNGDLFATLGSTLYRYSKANWNEVTFSFCKYPTLIRETIGEGQGGSS